MSTIATTTVSMWPVATTSRSSARLSGASGIRGPSLHEGLLTIPSRQGGEKTSAQESAQQRGRAVDVLLHLQPRPLRLPRQDRVDDRRVLHVGVREGRR